MFNNSKDSDSTSVFEIQSRHPGMDDFDRMSYMSKGSIHSKTSAGRIAQKFGKTIIIRCNIIHR